MNNVLAPSSTARPTDFGDVVALLATLSQAEVNLAKLQQTVDADHLEAVRGHLPVYKEIQATIGDCQAALELIAARNPQWFEDKKSIATPVGELKRTTSTTIEVADPGVTMTLIKAAKREGDFIKVTEELRLEVLQTLNDEQLQKLGVKRVVTHNFKIAPIEVKLGKAVKAAEKSAKAAAATAKKAVAS